MIKIGGGAGIAVRVPGNGDGAVHRQVASHGGRPVHLATAGDRMGKISNEGFQGRNIFTEAYLIVWGRLKAGPQSSCWTKRLSYPEYAVLVEAVIFSSVACWLSRVH